MDFPTVIKTRRIPFTVPSYFDGRCLQCNSTDTKKRSSYKRNVADLGTPFEKVIAVVTMATIECNECGCKFTPIPPRFPLKYQYSLAVISWAMTRYYHENASANDIAASLKRLHNVEVPVDTIYTWIKRLSDDYAKTMLKPRLSADEADTCNKVVDEGEKEKKVKTISVDGTHVTTGVDVVGKKKRAGYLSLTRRKDGTLLPRSRK